MPTNSKPAKLSKLSDLIQFDADTIQLYDEAIERVDDPAVRQDLESFRGDHGRHVAELTQVVFDLGGQARAVSRSRKGVVLEAFAAMRGATDNRSVLEVVLINERLTNKAYAEVAELRLPLAASRVVTRNFDDERRHLAAIERHLERLARGGRAITQDDLELDEIDIDLTELDEIVVIEIDDVPRERA